MKIFLKSLYKHLNDFSRPLPSSHFGVSSFEQKFSTYNNINSYFFTIPGKKFMRRSVRYAGGPWYCSSKFNTTQAELLNVANDPILLNIISEMGEKMFNVQINCSIERYKNIPEQTERILVGFLLQTSVDVKDYLKYNAEQESVVLPTGYIENPYKHRDQGGGSTVYVC